MRAAARFRAAAAAALLCRIAHAGGAVLFLASSDSLVGVIVDAQALQRAHSSRAVRAPAFELGGGLNWFESNQEHTRGQDGGASQWLRLLGQRLRRGAAARGCYGQLRLLRAAVAGGCGCGARLKCRRPAGQLK